MNFRSFGNFRKINYTLQTAVLLIQFSRSLMWFEVAAKIAVKVATKIAHKRLCKRGIPWFFKFLTWNLSNRIFFRRIERVLERRSVACCASSVVGLSLWSSLVISSEAYCCGWSLNWLQSRLCSLLKTPPIDWTYGNFDDLQEQNRSAKCTCVNCRLCTWKKCWFASDVVNFLKSKLGRNAKFLSSPSERWSKNTSFYKFPAR